MLISNNLDTDFPRFIWQTYKTAGKLPLESLGCMESWVAKNPSWTPLFCDDSDIAECIHSFFPDGVAEVFHSLPLGVMKADLWRYAILYEFGGIYADIDTVCRSPLEEWLNRDQGDLHISTEGNGIYFCQWTIAAPRRHPILLEVLNLIIERVGKDSGVDESRPHYVHYYTGPGVWTDAIKKYLDTEGTSSEILLDSTKWVDKSIQIYPSSYFDGLRVSHLNASYHWRNSPSGYASWLEERKDQAFI